MKTRNALMVFAAVWIVTVGLAVGMVFLVAWISPETVQGVFCAHQYETTTPNGVTYRVCVRTP
ncbi:hypothetical protein V1227_18825 [Lentzea sp. DG1S-22]|uniref:hypothetical protein n=1 Tax=unclassified Lentzea TaxID=2643253 RepID=UPI00224A6BFD|nr:MULTISPECIES: hypothetical protein [unclassified Lentzea]MCX2949919.1 hypothetical protein [Lentzea sp. NEAU-D7]WVH84704.1 hypothetical protein V1227_18825 [Lentzea sp. DG1S-22]